MRLRRRGGWNVPVKYEEGEDNDTSRQVSHQSYMPILGDPLCSPDLPEMSELADA